MSERSARRRIGVYGWGVVAPGARDVASLESLLRSGGTGLSTSPRDALGRGLFAVGEPAFDFDDYQPWIAERHGETYCARLRSKMNDNVQFAVGATIQALRCDAKLEALVRALDEQCHVYIGSGVGDLPVSYQASTSLTRATRAWNRFWAEPAHNTVRRRFASEGVMPDEAHGPLPVDPATFPVDSVERADAHEVWDAFWAAHSPELAAYLKTFAAIEHQGADDADADKAAINAIRKRVRAHRTELEALGAPPPPWTSVDSQLIWNIQNAPAAQITMLLGTHGAAWAPVGACSTFGVVLKCGMDAIELGDAKLAVVGSTASAAGSGARRRLPQRPRDARHRRGESPADHAPRHPRLRWRLHVDHRRRRVGRGAGPRAARLRGRGGAGLGRRAHHHALEDRAQARHRAGLPRREDRSGRRGHRRPARDRYARRPERARPRRRLPRAGHGDHRAQGAAGPRHGQLRRLGADGAGHRARQGRGARHGHRAQRGALPVDRPERIVTSTRPVTGKVGIKMMLGIGGITACVVVRAPR